MTRLSVGILRGGTSSEYDLSLKTGAAMLSALPEDRYATRDIFIDKRGYWHVRGTPMNPARALSQVDVVLNALHGGVGEDGSVQRILDRAGVPYAGSRPHSALLALNKIRARDVFIQAGIQVPQAIAFSVNSPANTAEMSRYVFQRFGPPYVVKPSSEGAAHGIQIATTLVDLPDILGDVLDAFGSALVEEYIRGTEASVGVIEGFRGEELYALPPAHVLLPDGSKFMDPAHHREATLKHLVPSPFRFQEKHQLLDMAKAAHRALGASHFSRADIIMTNRGPYLLEVNSLPGLYAGSSFPHMLESVGSSVREFLEHSIQLAMR